MTRKNLENELKNNTYPGRGIMVGKSADGKRVMTAYFIMGRSENSRNRVFETVDRGIRTKAFDPSKLSDPSLIIYAPVRVWNTITVITNGDQTDTIVEGLDEGLTMEQALRSRTYEPDGPNFTPRISACVELTEGEASFAVSILKSCDGNPDCHVRNLFTYEHPLCGEGRFIHTYMSDGNPLPSFEGEPKAVELGNEDIDTFAEKVWTSLNEDNKVSLFIRFIDIETGAEETRIINKNK